MKSIVEGPYHMGTKKVTLAGGVEGALQLGPEQDRVFSDLTQEENDRYKADIRATNILLQGLPKYIYALINHYTDAKGIWDNVKMLLEGSEYNVNNQGRQFQRNYTRGVVRTGNAGGQNRVGNLDPCRAKPIKCYNLLDEEQLLFIAGEQVTNFDDDVDDPPEQDLALNTMFMVNLSSEDPIYDKAGPSYDSDIPSEYVEDNAERVV
nr:hypothetical protein [Tanacetum cinerariifolium]